MAMLRLLQKHSRETKAMVLPEKIRPSVEQAPPPAREIDIHTPTVSPFDWSQLRQQPLSAFRDDLREIGCPISTIRDLLEPLVAREYNEKRRSAVEPGINRFWELACPPGKGMIALRERIDSLNQEESSALAELFQGVPEPSAPDESGNAGNPNFDNQLEFLPSEMADRVRAAREAFILQCNEVPAGGEEREARIRELQDAFQAQLASFLSAEELAEFKLRQSNFSNLRDLTDVDLSPEEVAKIIRLRESLSDESAENPNVNDRLDEREELEKLLGPERTKQLLLAEEPDYQAIHEAASQTPDPTGTALRLWEVRSRYSQMANQLLSGEIATDGSPPLDDEARQDLLKTLQQELENEYSRVLGNKDNVELLKYLQKEWLDTTFTRTPPDPWIEP